MKFKNYKGKGIDVPCIVSIKIDGVHAMYNEKGEIVSRHGKPLYNIPPFPRDTHVEVYLGDFKSTIQAVRTHEYREIPKEALYEIYPSTDHRLFLGGYASLGHEQIINLLNMTLAAGFEGLIIATKKYYYKVKKSCTLDVPVIGVIAGRGKHEGRMGALLTPCGKVGTGFTDAERELFTEAFIIGKIIEVGGMELTADNKVRHPRFIRLREDK